MPSTTRTPFFLRTTPIIPVLAASWPNRRCPLLRNSKQYYQRRINKLSIGNKQGIGSLDFINISVGFRFTPNDFQNQNMNSNESDYGTEEELNYINSNPEEYVDFKIPWSVNGSYNLNRTKIGFRDATITQTLNLSGDLSLTEKTKAEAEEAEANQQVLNKSPLGIYIG